MSAAATVERAERPANFAWVCAITTLLSALLLFLVQPIISKIILPWFGGSPAVWTTCMLFFQSLLLAGYAYAHWLVRALSPSWQVRVHGFMTLAACMTLPITPGVPTGEVESTPVTSILWLLGMNVGLPFFVLSATGPLVQSWFSGVYPGRPPYRLYALSNVGSLAALWLFPIVLEPRLNSAGQDLLFSAGLGIYLLCLFVASLVHDRAPLNEDDVIYPAKAAGKEPIALRDLVLWVALPALGSMLSVAVTAQICQDVAVVPFLWIMPLSLYLVTFILAFDSPRWYVRWVWGALAALSLVAVGVVMNDYATEAALNKFAKSLGANKLPFDLTSYTGDARYETAAYLMAFFCVAMICHGETARRKPDAGNLTLYFLMISLGGALGSGFVALVCPYVFDRYYELNAGLVLGYLLGAAVLVIGIQQSQWDGFKRTLVTAVVTLALSMGLAVVVLAQLSEIKTGYDIQLRNFYGVASVKTEFSDRGNAVGRVLYNGKINHGYQFLKGPRRYQAHSYYAEGSGVDTAFDLLYARQKPIRIGVIGLGTGNLAAFARKGDSIQFYEIDPKILRLANEYFTYLEDTPADAKVNMGDARLTLERQLEKEGSQEFDILVLDAFSGDAIPVHLLTLQAMNVYRDHLKPDGILAVHVSNRHLNLAPVVARLAKEVDASAVLIEREETGGNYSYNAASDWVLVTGDRTLLSDPLVMGLGELLDEPKEQGPLWTDSFSNLWQVLD